MYFCRLNSDNINPIVKEAYMVNKTLHNAGMHTWYSAAINIFKDLDINIDEYTSFDKPFKLVKDHLKIKFKKIIQDKYEEKTLLKISKITNSSKLFLYSKVKKNMKMEEYLINENSFKNRQLVTKFRLSDHNLNIEMGRYSNIPRENRLCNICQVLEDENHFFFHCKINKSLREVFLQKVNIIRPDFIIQSEDSKLFTILQPGTNLLPMVCDFIKQSMELRR